MVEGMAQAGDVAVMSALKPGDFEVVAGGAGCFEKAIDVTAPALPSGTDTLEQVVAGISDALRALGGDHPSPGGGPSSPFANTWSYLKARVPGAPCGPYLSNSNQDTALGSPFAAGLFQNRWYEVPCGVR